MSTWPGTAVCEHVAAVCEHVAEASPKCEVWVLTVVDVLSHHQGLCLGEEPENGER